MKRFLLILTLAVAAASCRVVDGDVTNPTTDDRIAEFCAEVFEERVSEALTYFYNAYYIARFVQGDAELKVSPEYDYIRTRLSVDDGKYSYDYCPYDFKGEDFFGEKGVCEIQSGRWYSVTITRVAQGNWRMAVKDGTVLNLLLLEEDEDGILLNMKVNGVMTEESSFTARLEAEEMEADIRHEHIGVIASKAFYGDMKVSFYDGATPLKTCTMTFKHGEYVRYDIDDHMTD